MSNQLARRRLAASAGVATLALALATALAPPAVADPVSACVPYRMPGFPSLGTGEVMTMNDAGLYVGGVLDASGSGHAAYWTHAGSDLSTGWTVHVPSLPFGNTEFLDVNQSGVLSGFSWDTGDGFVFDSRTQSLTVLPSYPGGFGQWARRINASGVVSGGAFDSTGTSYATIWKPPYITATRLHLPGEGQNVTFPDGTHTKVGSEADGINDYGTVAAYTFLGGPVHDVPQWSRTKQWRNGYAPLIQALTASEDGHVTRLPAGYDQAIGFAINDSGLVVGDSLRDGQHWFMPAYWRDGVEHDMGAPADANAGYAYNVSSGGWATGGIELPTGQRSFVWTGAGSLQLNEPLPGDVDSWSHGVNDALGQVAGASFQADGAEVPTVWQCPAGFTTG